MPKYQVHYKLVCEGTLELDLKDKDEAAEALASDFMRLYKESDFDNIEIVGIE